MTKSVSFSDYLAGVPEIIEEARNGRMFILVDDEDRENEGDLIIPAQMATPDVINFMAKHGRGLICLALTSERCDQLGLQLMPAHNQSRLATAFTLSIEAKDGVTTGISASDRAHTVAVAIDPGKDHTNIATPGHVFPLMARDGGVLVRAGHTEAAVDVARMAGLNPAGVICEIMNDDGTMARMPDLVKFAQLHGIKIGTIADLIAYRASRDKLVDRIAESDFSSEFGGDWRMIVYKNTIEYAEHIALVKGNLKGGKTPMVRVHQLNLMWDILGDSTSGKSGETQRAMKQIAEYGTGALLLIRDTDKTSFSDRVKAMTGESEGASTKLIDYGVGAQMLLDLGISEMILLSNSAKTIVGLEGYELAVVEQRAIEGASS